MGADTGEVFGGQDLLPLKVISPEIQILTLSRSVNMQMEICRTWHEYKHTTALGIQRPSTWVNTLEETWDFCHETSVSISKSFALDSWGRVEAFSEGAWYLATLPWDLPGALFCGNVNFVLLQHLTHIWGWSNSWLLNQLCSVNSGNNAYIFSIEKIF